MLGLTIARWMANSVGLDETPRAAFYLGLDCFLMLPVWKHTVKYGSHKTKKKKKKKKKNQIFIAKSRLIWDMHVLAFSPQSIIVIEQ